jgi:hypothetical protein
MLKQPGRYTGVIEAKDALATFQVANGFKIEMVASEPLISDPVARMLTSMAIYM